jgi:hypothetical protein
VIVEFRDAVAHHLNGSPWPVHRLLPGDVGALPCIAVPRPRLQPAEASLTKGTLVVFVVGSRLDSDDAQAELDDVTDIVVDRFGGLGKTVRLESPLISRLLLTDVAPNTVLVAGIDYPAYALTLEATFTLC